MLFMLRIEFGEDRADALLDYFEEHGLTRYKQGVEIRGAWASREQGTVYVVTEAEDATRLETATQDLHQFGKVEYHPVIDAFQL